MCMCMCMCVCLNSCVFLFLLLANEIAILAFSLSLSLHAWGRRKWKQQDWVRDVHFWQTTGWPCFSCWVKVLETHFASYVYRALWSPSLSLYSLSVWAVFVCKRRVRERKQGGRQKEQSQVKDNKQQPPGPMSQTSWNVIGSERERDMCAKSKGLYICVFLSLFLLKST